MEVESEEGLGTRCRAHGMMEVLMSFLGVWSHKNQGIIMKVSRVVSIAGTRIRLGASLKADFG
jgi:hypothetical protein